MLAMLFVIPSTFYALATMLGRTRHSWKQPMTGIWVWLLVKIFPKEGKRVYAPTVSKTSEHWTSSSFLLLWVAILVLNRLNYNLNSHGPSLQADRTVANTIRTGHRILLRPAVPVTAANLVHTYFQERLYKAHTTALGTGNMGGGAVPDIGQVGFHIIWVPTRWRNVFFAQI